MKVLLPLNGLSQWNDDVMERFRRSACGPTTARAILGYYGETVSDTDHFYRSLGTTRIGLFTWRFIRRFKKAASGRYRLRKVRDIDGVKAELLAGRPLAMKFDRYFSFRWRMQSDYAYHWVPLVGFEETADDLLLLIHDNGGKGRPSRLRKVSYRKNRPVLTFVSIEPHMKQKVEKIS